MHSESMCVMTILGLDEHIILKVKKWVYYIDHNKNGIMSSPTVIHVELLITDLADKI